jgi:hypothetical protein
MAADWGSGTTDAYAVAGSLAKMKPEITVHLGDVYYSGTADEFRTFFVPANCWPQGTFGAANETPRAHGTYILNGNHEMYSGGEGYFGVGLGAYRQATSYFCLANKYWRLVALDTGYNCSKHWDLLLIKAHLKKDSTTLPGPNIEWLKSTAFGSQADQRPVILLSHHQPFSAFPEDVYPQIVPPLSPFLDQVVLWFWGHEHRLALYGKYQGVRGRCIGHGGIPVELPFPPPDPKVPLVVSDARPGRPIGGQQVGLNGFIVLSFGGPTLVVRYYDEQSSGDSSAFLLEERWEQQSPAKLVGSVQLGPRGQGLTITGDLQSLVR